MTNQNTYLQNSEASTRSSSCLFHKYPYIFPALKTSAVVMIHISRQIPIRTFQQIF